APDAEQRGGAAEPGRAQQLDDGAVHRLALVPDRLGRVDHELLPAGRPVPAGPGSAGPGHVLAVPFADTDPLQGEQRAAQQRAELGQHPADLLARADRDDHHRDLGVPAEEGGPLAAAVCGAVHAEQRGGAVDAAPVQQVADGDEGGHPVDSLLAAQVDGQLGRLVGPRHGGVVQQPGALHRDQAGAGQREGRAEYRLDLRPNVDRQRDQRQVLGQRQRAVGAQVVLEPEALGAAEEDAGRDRVPPVQLEQGVRDERVAAALPFAEVGGQLLVLGHRCSPICWPSAAAATPAARLTATLSAALPCWRSSVSRWVSSIQVENVVYEPTAAVPASRASSWPRASPVSRPRITAPDTLTARVPSGKSRPALCWSTRAVTAPSPRKRSTDPAPPISTTAAHSTILMRAPGPGGPPPWPGGSPRTRPRCWPPCSRPPGPRRRRPAS